MTEFIHQFMYVFPVGYPDKVKIVLGQFIDYPSDDDEILYATDQRGFMHNYSDDDYIWGDATSVVSDWLSRITH